MVRRPRIRPRALMTMLVPRKVPVRKSERVRRLTDAGVCQLHGGILLELHLRQNLSEVFETATPRWSNAPNWHVELLGDRLVREVVVPHQQAQEVLTTRGELFCGQSQRSHLLVFQQAGIERPNLVISLEVQSVSHGDDGASGGDPQALAPRSCRQPGSVRTGTCGGHNLDQIALAG